MIRPIHDHDLSAATWHKSSYSGPENNCVETAVLPNGIAVRDSKHPEGGALRFSAAAWSDFLRGVGNGEF